MSNDGDGLVNLAQVIDALLVGLLVFFAVILGDLIPAYLTGNPTYLTTAEIVARMPTGIIAMGLAFIFQWLRARGIDVLDAYRRFKDNLP